MTTFFSSSPTNRNAIYKNHKKWKHKKPLPTSCFCIFQFEFNRTHRNTLFTIQKHSNSILEIFKLMKFNMFFSVSLSLFFSTGKYLLTISAIKIQLWHYVLHTNCGFRQSPITWMFCCSSTMDAIDCGEWANERTWCEGKIMEAENLFWRKIWKCLRFRNFIKNKYIFHLKMYFVGKYKSIVMNLSAFHSAD